MPETPQTTPQQEERYPSPESLLANPASAQYLKARPDRLADQTAKYKQQQAADAKAFQSISEAAPPAQTGGAGAGGTAEQPGFFNTLGREVSAFGSTVNPINAVKGVYHAVTDEPTAEEKAQGFGGAGRIALPAHRMVVKPLDTAANFYSRAAYGQEPDAYGRALEVAPEAFGQAGGAVVAGKAMDAAGNIIKSPTLATAGHEIVGDTMPGTTGGNVPLPFRNIATPLVRGAAKTANVVLPAAAGAGVGAGIGAAFGHPALGAELGFIPGAAGSLVRGVRDLVPTVPGEEFGLTTMEKQGATEPSIMRVQDQGGYQPIARPAMKSPMQLGLTPASQVQGELPLTPGEHFGDNAEFENMTDVQGPSQVARPQFPSNPAAGRPIGLSVKPDEVQVEQVEPKGEQTVTPEQANKSAEAVLRKNRAAEPVKVENAEPKPAKAAPQPEQDKAATDFTAKVKGEMIPEEEMPKTVKDIKDASHRQAIHTLGDPANAVDFYNKPSGPQALQMLKQLSHEQLQRYMQTKGINTSGFSMSRSGLSGANPVKSASTRLLLDKVSPEQVVEDLGR